MELRKYLQPSNGYHQIAEAHMLNKSALYNGMGEPGEHEAE